ncbi:SLC13 family permease [Thiosocius teredinicola]|uniref:SLC13 family permease n=1 Tax=Thiosocius teredinicola TaxID=1973002 RepID=UPI000990C3A3
MPATAGIANKTTWTRLLVAVLAGAVVWGAAAWVFPGTQAILTGLIAFLVILWTNEGLPLGAVSLLPLILFPAFGIADMQAVAANYANPIIFLFLGGFMLAIAVEATGLHQQIAFRLLAIFPNTARGMIFALALVAGLLSAFLSNTTTALLLMPLAMFLTDEPRLNVRFALAIAYGASVGGVATPIGTPPNLILLGFMEQHAIEPWAFVQWIGLVLPLEIAMFIAVGMLLSFGVSETRLSRPASAEKLNPGQRRVAYTLGGLLLLLLVNSPIQPFYAGLGLDERAILLAFGLSMLLPGVGVLNWTDCRKIPYEIIFLFGAGFSIAHAFGATGLSQAIGDLLLALTTLDLWLLIVIVALLVTFTTEITSNTALISMILPVVHSVSSSGALNSTLFMLVATICASYAFMLPIATPPNAIAIASGTVRPLTMMRFGLLLNLTGIALISLFALGYWRFVL